MTFLTSPSSIYKLIIFDNKYCNFLKSNPKFTIEKSTVYQLKSVYNFPWKHKIDIKIYGSFLLLYLFLELKM